MLPSRGLVNPVNPINGSQEQPLADGAGALDDSLDDDEEASPLKPSKAEEEYEQMLLSPAQVKPLASSRIVIV